MHEPTVRFHDGCHMPMVGVGLYKIEPVDVEHVVEAALALGYRLFDTAAMYGNEEALGRAIRRSGVPRDEVFVTTKVLNSDHGFRETRLALQRSLELLRIGYVDLYLIHWPAPRQNRFVETWEALISLRAEGLARSIGVSNFHPHHLDQLARQTDVVPVMNQVECHPWLPQNQLRSVHRDRRIVTQSWSPLARGRALTDPTLARLSAQLGVSPAQLILAWQLQRSVAVIPKSTHVNRLRENRQAIDLQLDPGVMSAIDALETGERTGADPDHRD